MRKLILLPAAILLFSAACAQQLTIEKIMRDPKWIGTSPDNLFWGADGKTVYFSWNPEKAPADSLYSITLTAQTPRKTLPAERQHIQVMANADYNTARTQMVYTWQGDVFLRDLASGKETRITHTSDLESGAGFGFHDSRILFRRNRNIYSWEIQTGVTEQLTDFVNGSKPAPRTEHLGAQDKYLKDQQQELFEVLKEKKAKTDAATAFNNSLPKTEQLRSLYLDDRSLSDARVSPDGRFVVYRVFREAGPSRGAMVPNFVTESGFTGELRTNAKVGTPQPSFESYVFDRLKDTVLAVKTSAIPGINDKPDYVKDYPGRDTVKKTRGVIINGPYWSEKGTNAIVQIRSQDNKDRWIMLLDAATGALKPLDRQRDEAWVGGPGINWGSLGWIDENTCWFQSEATGYSHLYTFNVNTRQKKALTQGNYEVQEAGLSRDKQYFYITTNEVHPGEKQFYRLPVVGGKAERITAMTGAHTVSLSPDEKWIAYRYSASNKPWEMYLQENKPGAKPVQITNLAMTDEFKAYPWREANVVTFKARDNQMVHARLYTPGAAQRNGAAVIFVHGAGYLQNAHKWWSQYYREYMFHNLLADLGYTVLDIDYRGSAGYGRDWRTGIYRHMGGKDLTDQVDGARFLAQQHGVDPKRIGIYGGSYGGFITLMALFTTPDDFAAGAALRSVTDWAHYNHGYTSNILNEPYTDSIAFRRSSPIYFAEGLKGHLLMCHGMVDTNVHFQDIVRLSQRLIELGKNNWELAVYPVEDHGFTEPASWTDEYKRILKLFDGVLLKH
ncbi:prolyl oligopeptidase family serine peptidase [Chitinophaga sp. GCM10012297]|uniref:S9 family peptidase n=1 Tax=Chitinophaga chungangae TaxID=2821488 RepID=A0ABS3YL14_9BACT|nr:prolyl oligopeptidase family serine peptidase [Chitinophaga chungangae]MBO9155383.1 S9 family peptidase [Chitinophaga chungangae]